MHVKRKMTDDTFQMVKNGKKIGPLNLGGNDKF